MAFGDVNDWKFVKLWLWLLAIAFDLLEDLKFRAICFFPFAFVDFQKWPLP